MRSTIHVAMVPSEPIVANTKVIFSLVMYAVISNMVRSPFKGIISQKGRQMWTDAMIDAHYSRDYYGPGTDYFEPPEWAEDDLEEVLEDE